MRLAAEAVFQFCVVAHLSGTRSRVVSASADKIVAQPATLTGSIGVLTGKVAVGKSLDMIGVGFEEVAIGIPEIHARCGSPRAVNVTWRTDVIDSAVPQVLLCFLNRAAPDQAEVSVSGQGNIGQVEFVVGADILRLVLRSQNVLLVDVDFLVIANLDGYLPLSPAPAIFIN